MHTMIGYRSPIIVIFIIAEAETSIDIECALELDLCPDAWRPITSGGAAATITRCRSDDLDARLTARLDCVPEPLQALEQPTPVLVTAPHPYHEHTIAPVAHKVAPITIEHFQLTLHLGHVLVGYFSVQLVHRALDFQQAIAANEPIWGGAEPRVGQVRPKPCFDHPCFHQSRIHAACRWLEPVPVALRCRVVVTVALLVGGDAPGQQLLQ